MILSDIEITNLCKGTKDKDTDMIRPYVDHQVRHEHIDRAGNVKKVISYGQSSFGYDIRIKNEFKIFTNVNTTVVDPKNFDKKSFVDFQGEICIIPPNSFVLAVSLEYFKMPRDVTGLVLGKSTYARCGVSCLATPLEAGWEGQVTLEFANTTPCPVRLFAEEGAAQVLFFKGTQMPLVSYADRNGKYQNQTGITLPIS